jgi:formylglycine-generating enzyme required for sulfatase activity
MGSPENEWGRGAATEELTPVELTHAFFIQQHEVSQEEWIGAGFKNPSGPASFGADCLEPECPVGGANWYEVLAFANYLSRNHLPPLKKCYDLDSCSGEIGANFACSTIGLTARTAYECEGYRLPTEAEWEYAARAGTRTAFYSGDITPQKDTGSCYEDANLDLVAWYCVNAGKSTHPVRQKTPNPWGLYDVLGNANEWVQDDTVDWTRLPSGPLTNPAGTMQFPSTARLNRGGLFDSSPHELRASSRLAASPDSRGTGLGFRLVRSILDGPQVDAADSGDGG